MNIRIVLHTLTTLIIKKKKYTIYKLFTDE